MQRSVDCRGATRPSGAAERAATRGSMCRAASPRALGRPLPRSIRMSTKPPIVRLASFGRRFLVLATLAVAPWGMTATVLGQEETADRTVRERIKEYWDRLIA